MSSLSRMIKYLDNTDEAKEWSHNSCDYYYYYYYYYFYYFYYYYFIIIIIIIIKSSLRDINYCHYVIQRIAGFAIVTLAILSYIRQECDYYNITTTFFHNNNNNNNNNNIAR
jgi:hypothetical protein